MTLGAPPSHPQTERVALTDLIIHSHFGIEWGQLHRGTVMVGTSDVKDLIRDSISKFRRSDGRVGSRGIMPCGPDEIAIVWGLY